MWEICIYNQEETLLWNVSITSGKTTYSVTGLIIPAWIELAWIKQVWLEQPDYKMQKTLKAEDHFDLF